MRSSSRTTRRPVREVSTTRPWHSLVKSSTSVRIRKRRPLTNVSVTKPSDQRRLRALRDHHGRSRTQCSFAAASLAHGQPLLLVQPIKLLAVELDALALQHQTKTTIAKPPPPADGPAACSFSTLMICSSVNLLLRISVSRRNGFYPKTGAFKGSRSRSNNWVKVKNKAAPAYTRIIDGTF